MTGLNKNLPRSLLAIVLLSALAAGGTLAYRRARAPQSLPQAPTAPKAQPPVAAEPQAAEPVQASAPETPHARPKLLPARDASALHAIGPAADAAIPIGEIAFSWEKPALEQVEFVLQKESGEEIYSRKTLGTRRTKHLDPGRYRWSVHDVLTRPESVEWIAFQVTSPHEAAKIATAAPETPAVERAPASADTRDTEIAMPAAPAVATATPPAIDRPEHEISIAEEPREATPAKIAAPVLPPQPEPVAVAPVLPPQPEPVAVAPVLPPQPEPVAVAPVLPPQPEPIAVAPVLPPQPEPIAVAPLAQPEPAHAPTLVAAEIRAPAAEPTPPEAPAPTPNTSPAPQASAAAKTVPDEPSSWPELRLELGYVGGGSASYKQLLGTSKLYNPSLSITSGYILSTQFSLGGQWGMGLEMSKLSGHVAANADSVADKSFELDSKGLSLLYSFTAPTPSLRKNFYLAFGLEQNGVFRYTYETGAKTTIVNRPVGLDQFRLGVGIERRSSWHLISRAEISYYKTFNASPQSSGQSIDVSDSFSFGATGSVALKIRDLWLIGVEMRYRLNNLKLSSDELGADQSGSFSISNMTGAVFIGSEF